MLKMTTEIERLLKNSSPTRKGWWLSERMTIVTVVFDVVGGFR